MTVAAEGSAAACRVAPVLCGRPPLEMGALWALAHAHTARQARTRKPPTQRITASSAAGAEARPVKKVKRENLPTARFVGVLARSRSDVPFLSRRGWSDD